VQFEQLVIEVAANAIENLPTSHVVHVDRVVAEYLPATQFEQLVIEVAANAIENLPALQLIQVVATKAPTVAEYLPALQFEQMWLPLDVL
jgi:hypothetical protein